MYDNDLPGTAGWPAARVVSPQLWKRLTASLTPLLAALDAHLDARLVRTLHATVAVFLQSRYPRAACSCRS